MTPESTVLRLRVGVLVVDSSNVLGKVVGFARDHVVIDMAGQLTKYTDADLQAHGVRVVEVAK